MVDLVDKAYAPKVIQHFPEGTTDESFSHSYSEQRHNAGGHVIPFDLVSDFISEAREKVSNWYREKTGQEFNNYNLGDLTQETREQFWQNPSFNKAIKILGYEPSEIREGINLPWWDELLAGEGHCEVIQDKYVHSDFAPMHSFELQLRRAGIETPLSAVGIDGVVLTTPDAESQTGYIPIGIRGGSSYPNTYHLLATGSLKATEGFKQGTQSITQVFKEEELLPEVGDLQDSAIKSIKPIARVEDYLLNNSPTYVFQVNTNLSQEGIKDLWLKNEGEDKGEFRDIFFIPADRASVKDFLNENYIGAVENKQDRTDEKRILLPPGALDLAAFAGITPQELRKFYRPGNW